MELSRPFRMGEYYYVKLQGRKYKFETESEANDFYIEQGGRW